MSNNQVKNKQAITKQTQKDEEMKGLAAIKTELHKLVDDNLTAIASTEKEIAVIDQVLAQKNEELVKAKKEINSTKYVDIKQELWTAEQTKTMLSERLKELKENPLLSEEKRQIIKREILSLADKINNEQLKKAKNLLTEFQELSMQSNETIELAEENLKFLYYKIMKHPFTAVSMTGGETEYRKDTLRGFYNILMEYTAFTMILNYQDASTPPQN